MPELAMEVRPDQTILVRQTEALEPWPRCITERLFYWAERHPDRTWMAERDSNGNWLNTSYAEAAAKIESIGSALLGYGLSAERPLLILSGNSVAHALMALGAQHCGIPSAALSPAYALTSGDRAKLAAIRDQLTPGMIFADHAERFLPAIDTLFADNVPVVCLTGAPDTRPVVRFDTLSCGPVSTHLQRAHAAIGSETVAKFLFTSGTTGSPKAVIQTHGMLCSNQAMIAQAYDFLTKEPPVLVDWAPWNHTASGNKVFNMAHVHGGTYYIDDGRPTPDMIGRTIRNLQEIAPTWYFNVPIGYQFLLDAMETDADLAGTFFSRLRMMMYAGAGMSQPVWDRLAALSARMVQGGVPVVSGLGATETGPFALYHTDAKDRPGNIGIPARGVTLKLVPQEGKLEARLKSPSITPGYWRNPALTTEAFDDEGFYRLGDALRFAVPGKPEAGFLFDGRLAENFKLATGTWVAVGPLRAALVGALGGLISDVVIAGEERDDLRALLVPDWAAMRALCGMTEATPTEVASHPAVRQALTDGLTLQAAAATGSATRIVAGLVLTEPLSFDLGEVTDKGSVNQRAVLRTRKALVDALWSEDPALLRTAPKGHKA